MSPRDVQQQVPGSVRRTVQRVQRTVQPHAPPRTRGLKLQLAMATIALGFGAAAVTANCVPGEATVQTACVPFDPLATDDPFVLVSEVLEKRCASLDCHGALARPLRIYGSSGLRRPEPDLGTEGCALGDNCGEGRICKEGTGCLDSKIYDYAEYYSGGSINTTPSERLENWRSICGLEPELMTVVYCCSAGEGTCNGFDYAASCASEDSYDPARLTLVRKARLREKHKGAQIWGAGDAGDRCVTDWLRGQFSQDSALSCLKELENL